MPRRWSRRTSSRLPAALGRAGLTLIEVVLAMAILSVGLLVLLGGFAEGGKAQRSAELATKAVILGQGLLDERLAGGDIGEGTEEGDWEAAPGFHWRLDVAPVEAEREGDGPEELLEVRLTATWPDAGRERSLELATLVPAAAE